MGRPPCCDKIGLKKGPWTPEEDQKLVCYLQKHGHASWRVLPKLAGLNRCGKSCRLRWTNYLRPGIKRGKFSEEEQQTILYLHAILGNKWSAIASHLAGRTDNEIKNFWNTNLKKNLIRMGYDPMTHQPQTDIFSSLPHLIALANQKELLDNQPWEKNATRLQAETVQLARLQCLQHLPLPQASTEANLNSINGTFTVTNLLNFFCLMKNNSVLSSPQLENSINPSLGTNNLQLGYDSISSSHMPNLKSPCNYLSLSSKDMVHPPDGKAFSYGESSPNSPWLLSCSSTPSPSPVAPLVTETTSMTQMGDHCSAHGIVGPSMWPELLMEDPLFHEIA